VKIVLSIFSTKYVEPEKVTITDCPELAFRRNIPEYIGYRELCFITKFEINICYMNNRPTSIKL